MTKPQSTRRDFLKTSAGAAALGSAFPYFWTTSSIAQDSPNERINVASIGVGGRGSGIARQAEKIGNMVACCDVDSGHAGKFVTETDGPCDSYGDYRHVLERKDVDAVTIGTPDHWHTKIAIDAMRAGKSGKVILDWTS